MVYSVLFVFVLLSLPISHTPSFFSHHSDICKKIIPQIRAKKHKKGVSHKIFPCSTPFL